jgi:NAD(P)H-flavin reductase
MTVSPQRFIGVIKEKKQLTNSVYHFVIQNKHPSSLLFQPGQYVSFIINQQTRRQYTCCSAPAETQFEIVIDVSPMGVGSKYFLDKEVGDGVEYLGPLGSFALSDNSLKKIFVATGTGIAPFRSMILEKVQSSSFMVHGNNNQQQVSTNYELSSMNYSLYWGLRFEHDVYWVSEFEALTRQYRGFKFFISLSKPGTTWHGLTGHITEHVFEKENTLQNCEFYLCGNSAMINDMRSRLLRVNVKDERIKSDLFY